MKYIYLLLFFTFVYSCNNSDEILLVDTEVCKEPETTITLKGTEIPLNVIGAYGLKIIDSTFIFLVDKAHYYEIYNINSNELLKNALLKGNAGNEFQFAGYNGQYITENGCTKMLIHDLNKATFCKYNLTESITNNTDSIEFIQKLPRDYDGVFYLSEDMIAYRNYDYEKMKYSYFIKNIKTKKIIDEYKIFNLDNDVFKKYKSIPMHSYISRDNNLIIFYSLKINQLLFIDLENKNHISVSTSRIKPTWGQLKNDFEDSSKLYYSNIAATKDKIYVLYNGNKDSLQIHCFNKIGELLAIYNIKEKLISFDVWDDVLYGLNNTEQLFKYSLKERTTD